MNRPEFNPAVVLRRHDRKVRLSTLALASMPALEIGLRWHGGNLGINPLDSLEKDTGFWALTYLMITLSVTPARRLFVRIMIGIGASYGKRLSDWNGLIPLRRQFGLTAFFYATMHVVFYVWLDAGMSIDNLRSDIEEKPFMLAGLVAFLFLIPLAATSTQRAMRFLRSNWRRLHRGVYLIGCAGVLHFVWLAKPGRMLPYFFAFVLTALLGYRLFAWIGIVFQRPRDDGMEVAPRPSVATDNSRQPVSTEARTMRAKLARAEIVHRHSGQETVTIRIRPASRHPE